MQLAAKPSPKPASKIKHEHPSAPKGPSFDEDFICVSEFSELVGPVPLFNIPDGGEGSFNLEDFVIRIMAVDCQNRTVDPGSYMEDSMVVISEPSEDAFAYVHHFTLLDIFARGYVRPICMSYITRCPSKIMDNFVYMVERFSQISSLLKEGNQIVFLRDLETRLRDLRLTKEVLQRESMECDEAEGSASHGDGMCASPAPTLQVVCETLEEMESMQSRLHASLLGAFNGKHKHTGDGKHSGDAMAVPRDGDAVVPGDGDAVVPGDGDAVVPGDGDAVVPGDGDAVVSGDGGVEIHIDHVDGSSSCHILTPSSLSTEHVDDLSDGGPSKVTTPSIPSSKDSAGMNPPQDDMARHQGVRDTHDTHVSVGDSNPVLEALYRSVGFVPSQYEPKFITSIHKGQRFEKLREPKELCGPRFEQSINLMGKVHQHFKRLNIVLALERDEFALVEPRSSLLTIGGTVLTNFNLQANRHTSLSYSLPVGDVHRVRTRDGVSAPDGVRKGATHPRGGDDAVSEDWNSIYNDGDPVGTRRGRSLSAAPPKKANRPEESSSSSESGDYHSPHDSFASLSPGPSEPSDGGGEDLYHSYGPHMLPPPICSPPPPIDGVESFSSIIWGCSVKGPGQGLMEALRKYPFIRHAVYSLLKGRPLIIYGRPDGEKAVRRLVRALSLFVVGVRHVQPWRSEPLRLVDLAGISLMGLSKTCAIPKAVERYSSILDIERQLLTAPPYSGTLIDDVLGYKVASWPDEATLLAYVNYKLLHLSTQACLYYHLCCVATDGLYSSTTSSNGITSSPGGAMSPSSTNHTSYRTYNLSHSNARHRTADPKSRSEGHLMTQTYHPLPQGVREREKANFFKRITNKMHDREVIMHMAEVVKEQQAREMQHASAGASPIIHLDYSKCAVFRRTKDGRKEGKTRLGRLYSV